VFGAEKKKEGSHFLVPKRAHFSKGRARHEKRKERGPSFKIRLFEGMFLEASSGKKKKKNNAIGIFHLSEEKGSFFLGEKRIPPRTGKGKAGGRE